MTFPYLLSVLIFLPLLAGVLLLLFGEEAEGTGLAYGAALSVSVLNGLLSLLLLGGGSFLEKLPWISSLGISYSLRVDGISLFLMLLVTVLTPLAILASRKLIKEQTKVYYGCILLLAGGMAGVLASADLFLFYVFWELMLIPAFFLIGMFGGANRRPAVTKFVIYTMVGSLLMLVGIAYVGYHYYALSGHWSFALADLYGMTFDNQAGRFAFAAFALAFAIKAALFPLHTWLPDAYGEAPAPVTFLLSAVMSKLGLYGFLRIALPLFPSEAHYFQPLLIGLAVTGVIYAALIALVQEDAKRVIAYASVSHLGIILLAIFTLSPQALSGSVLHMVAHALTTGALFLMVGFLYERKGTTLISAFGGITQSIPFFAGIFMLITLASVGLPGLAGFVGEFLIFLGAFGAHPVPASIATVSVVLGASYMLWMFQRVMFGPLTGDENRRLPELSGREALALLPIVALVIFIGVAPQFLLGRINPAITTYLTLMKAPAVAEAPQSTRQAMLGAGGVR